MKVYMQSYICPKCGAGTVTFKGYGEDTQLNYYRVFACDALECDFDDWRMIPYRDFPSDVPPEKLFLKVQP